MSIPTLLIVLAGVLAFAELVRSEGRALTAWGVLAIAAALVWGPRL